MSLAQTAGIHNIGNSWFLSSLMGSQWLQDLLVSLLVPSGPMGRDRGRQWW